ncbi:6-aminohexanoate hydrolase [Pandoraea anapnoica]|uniref:6-aminohexanoate hydrolase n=1 Tax=Pandoraea anapnoica TaxID=2508301 RepID=A0A5E5AKZ6_9BURK|nr:MULTISPECIES: serine hydrolase [Pandoraea]VVE42678.1 6-aminohexanoate hydrolase [Pandoraea iniqua]VVE73203.1 6-aminohexanoate hydrolase [Pandoraea anapnoica]
MFEKRNVLGSSLHTMREGLAQSSPCARNVITGALAAVAMGISISAMASAPVDNAELNPTSWMQGSPPSPDASITLDNGGFVYPKNRWSFSNMRRLMPSANVWRGDGQPSPLVRSQHISSPIGDVTFADLNGVRHKFSDLMQVTDADGIIVLHKGKVVYEEYAGVLKSEMPHAVMSVTKSIVGTIAAMLVEDGRLDADAQVTQYVPELAGSAFDGATVRQVMDMTIGVQYSEQYSDPSAQIWAYFRAAGVIKRPDGYVGPTNLYDFLKTLKRNGEHGAAFAYKTPDAEVLGWIIKRSTGRPLSELVSAMIWQPMGAQDDAYFDVDSQGTECAGGGFNATLRDLARFGEVMRNEGRYNGRQIVPARVVAEIRGGGDRGKFAMAGFKTLPGWSYKDMWWVSGDDHGAYEARGIFGQAIYVDPEAEMTIVRLASTKLPANGANDWITLPAFRAVGEFLMAAKSE